MLLNVKIGYALLASIVITVLVLRPIDSFDIWWHLNSGLWMLDNGKILDYDIWSFTHPGSTWLNLAWLFQIIIAIAYSLGDVWGLFILKAFFIFATFLLISHSIRSEHRNITLFISFLVLLPGIYGHLHLRPHLLELVGLSFIVLISQTSLTKQKTITSFFVLLIWANIHASVAVAAIAVALQFMFGNWNTTLNIQHRLVITSLLLLTPLMSPYGIDITSVLFAHGGSDFIQYYVSEWLPHDSYPTEIWLSLLIIFLLFTNRIIKISIAESFLLLFFLLYSIKHQRFELELCILMLRPLSECLGYGLNKLKSQSPKYPFLISVLIIMLHSIIYSGYIQSLSPEKYKTAPYDKFRYPSATLSQTINISSALGRPLKVINDYNFGGYISLFTNGSTKVFIDSRMSTVFPESLLLTPYESDPALLTALTNRYDADIILLKLDSANVFAGNNVDWQLTAYDAASVLFTKRSLAEKLNLPEIKYDPRNYSNSHASDDVSENIISTKKLLEYEQDNPVALNHLAVFLTNDISSREDEIEILTHLERSSLLLPDNIFSQATITYLAAISNHNASIALFLKYLPDADKLHPGISHTYALTYARVLIDNKLYKLALDYLYPDNKERRYSIDRLFETWRLRILAHIQLDEIKKAKNCLEIAYELSSHNENERQELDRLKQLLHSI